MSIKGFTTNTLLLRDDVGRAKPSHYDLPEEGYVYGKKLIPDKEELTMTWKFHDFSDKAKCPRDFKTLNKMVVKDGMSTSKDVAKFRRTHDARLMPKKGKNMIQISLPDSEFRYGIRNRPSTPMKNVMGNYYGIEAELISLQRYHEEIEHERNRIRNLTKGNKSAKLSAERNKEKIQELRQGPKKDLFKLSKFTNKATSKVKDTLKRNKAELDSRIMQNSNLHAFDEENNNGNKDEENIVLQEN